MAVTQVRCPSCATLLQLAALPPAGTGIKCPKCAKVFRIAAPAPAGPPAAAAPKPAKAAPTAPPPAPPRPAKASPAPPSAAARKSDTAAPRSVSKAPAKPAAKPVARSRDDDEPDARPVRKRPPVEEDDRDEKPVRKGPVARDDDEPEEKPVRKRRVMDDEEDEAPAKRRAQPKKSGKGKVLLVVAALLFLVCGGAIAGTIWAVNSFFNKVSDAVAQMTGKNAPAADGIEKKQPAQVDVVAKPPVGDAQPGDGLDVRFVPSDFVAGAVINGPRLLKSPVVTSLLPDEVFSRMGEEWGIDPHKVERVLILLEPTPGGNVLFFPGGIIRFREPVDGKAVLSRTLEGLQEASADGKPYFVSRTEKMAGTPIAGHVADQQTLLIAPEPTLKKMLAAKGDGPLAEQLRRLDLNSDVAAAFVVEPVRALAGEALKDAKKELPPDFPEVGTLHERLKAGRLSLNLTGDTLLKVALDAEDDDSAAAVEKLLTRGKDLLKQAYPDIRKDLTGALPPDLAGDALALAERVPDGIQVSRSGSAVTLTLKSPGDLAALAKKVSPILMDPGRPPARPSITPKTFISLECGFLADFPGEPTKTVKDKTTTFEVKADGGTTHYSVICTETPNETNAAQAKAVLDAVARGFDAKSIKSQRDIDLTGHPGRELVIELNQGAQVVVTDRIYLVKKRMYQVMVTSLKSRHDAAAAKRFLDSFALVKDAAPEKPAAPVKPAAEASVPVPALPPKPLPGPATTGDSLKGDTRAVMDVSVTSVKLPSKTMLPCLTWADDKGSAFYALDDSGTLRRVSFPDLKEEWTQVLGERCAWLSLSAEGLLITPAGGKEVWLIDPAKGEMKSRFAIARVKRAVSTAGSSFAVATAGDALHVLDLKKGTSLKYDGPRPQRGGLDDPVLTPDGKYLFTAGRLGLGQMHRWAIIDGRLGLEESSGGVTQGRIDSGITVSPDSKWVCFPSYVGGGAQPPKNYTLSVFAVGDLKKPAFVLDPGGTAVGFDPAGGYIYAQNLRLFDYGGKFLKEYRLGSGPPMITVMGQILVHPAGGTFLMIGDNNVLAVSVPKN